MMGEISIRRNIAGGTMVLLRQSEKRENGVIIPKIG
jgi:hypothetical protein